MDQQNYPKEQLDHKRTNRDHRSGPRGMTEHPGA